MMPFPRGAAFATVLLALSSARAQEPEPAGKPAAPAEAKPASPSGAAAEEEEEEDEEETPAEKPRARPASPAPRADKAPAGATSATRTDVRGEPPPAQGALAPGWRERARVALGPLTLAPIALIQTQASPVVGEDSLLQAGDIAERPGLRLRRARFGLGGAVLDQARFALSAQVGGDDDGTARLHDAWAGYTAIPELQIFAGARDVAFSRSAITGAGDGALIERPLAVRAIAPFTQLGIQVEGHFQNDAFSYSAGVYNGFQRSDQFYAGQAESYAPLGNRFEGVAVSGRLATEPLGTLGRTVEDLGRSPFRIGAGADYFFSSGGARTQHGASADVLLHASGLHALGEVLWTRSIPKSVPTQPIVQVDAISSIALVFEAGYMLVARTFGVSGRVEWIDPNPDVDDEGDNVVITAGASYHALDDFLKAQLDFTHREELHGVSLSNDALTLQLQLSL